jgi:hypothetical protein
MMNNDPSVTYSDVRDEIKPVLLYTSENIRYGDSVYVYYYSQYAYEYYKERYKLEKFDIIIGSENHNSWSVNIKDIQNLTGRGRVWVIISSKWFWRGTNILTDYTDITFISEEKYILYNMDIISKRIDERHSEGASVYLYEFD